MSRSQKKLNNQYEITYEVAKEFYGTILDEVSKKPDSIVREQFFEYSEKKVPPPSWYPKLIVLRQKLTQLLGKIKYEFDKKTGTTHFDIDKKQAWEIFDKFYELCGNAIEPKFDMFYSNHIMVRNTIAELQFITQKLHEIAYRKNVSSNIAKVKQASGLSLREIAERCQISPAYLSQLSRGLVSLSSIDIAKKILDVADISKEYNSIPVLFETRNQMSINTVLSTNSLVDDLQMYDKKSDEQKVALLTWRSRLNKIINEERKNFRRTKTQQSDFFDTENRIIFERLRNYDRAMKTLIIKILDELEKIPGKKAKQEFLADLIEYAPTMREIDDDLRKSLLSIIKEVKETLLKKISER